MIYGTVTSLEDSTAVVDVDGDSVVVVVVVSCWDFVRLFMSSCWSETIVSPPSKW